jgi:hypothetical protein
VRLPGPTRQSMLALARDLDVQYKTAFVMAHKLREAMAASVRGLRIGGEGRVAEIDGAYFGGHVRPENLAADRIDRRLVENKSGKRRAVVVMRERGGRTLPQVFASEDAALASIGQRIAKGTTVHADESPAWNPLHARFSMHRINHQHGYSIGGACTNGAESYFSRLRRAELGHHHHIAGPYLLRYAQEAAWREDLRRVSNGEQGLCCMDRRGIGWGRMMLGVLPSLSGVGPCRSKPMPSVVTTSQSSVTGSRTLRPTTRPCGSAAA